MPEAVVTAIIVTIITTAISYLIAPKPKAPRFSASDEIKGILVNKDANNNPIPTVYGQRQVGLIRTYVESSGTDNEYLYVAGILCEGGGAGIQEISEIYVDDKLVVWSGALTDTTLRTVNSSDTNFYKDAINGSPLAARKLSSRQVVLSSNKTCNINNHLSMLRADQLHRGWYARK